MYSTCSRMPVSCGVSQPQTASQVVALAYADYANAQQKASLVEEFYKADYAIFKVGIALVSA